MNALAGPVGQVFPGNADSGSIAQTGIELAFDVVTDNGIFVATYALGELRHIECKWVHFWSGQQQAVAAFD